MFSIGDFIIYGNNGVCRVVDIGNIDSPGISKERIYYTLEPCYKSGNKIFTPTDNNKVIMRPILNRNEAMSLIDEIKNIEILWIQDEKQRELSYKEVLKGCNYRELVKIIKTIYLRKQSRLAEGKKTTAIDEKYFNIAEENLYGELATALDMSKDEAKEYVVERVGEFGN